MRSLLLPSLVILVTITLLGCGSSTTASPSNDVGTAAEITEPSLPEGGVTSTQPVALVTGEFLISGFT